VGGRIVSATERLDLFSEMKADDERVADAHTILRRLLLDASCSWSFFGGIQCVDSYVRRMVILRGDLDRVRVCCGGDRERRTVAGCKVAATTGRNVNLYPLRRGAARLPN
jgi:hypothetical protein